MKKPFSRASAKPVPDIATKSELNNLRRLREKPEPRLQLTPNGLTTLNVNRRVAFDKEQRLQDVQARLDRMKTTLRKGIRHTQSAGKAKSAFQKSR